MTLRRRNRERGGLSALHSHVWALWIQVSPWCFRAPLASCLRTEGGATPEEDPSLEGNLPCFARESHTL